MEKRQDTITGVSGIDYVISELETKHQEWMTDKGGQFNGENLNRIYADCIKQIGGNPMPSSEKDRLVLVGDMPSADRKKVLFGIRQLAVGDVFPTFDFDYTWEVTEDGKNKIEKTAHTLEIDLEKFEETSYKRRNSEGELEEVKVKNLAELDKHHKIRVPRSEKLVRFSILDGRLEAMVSNTKKKDRNSSTLVNARNPTYLNNEDEAENSDNPNPIWIKFDKRPLVDTEVLKKEMSAVEGNFDTTMIIEHPDREGLTATVNLLQLINFFFPSGAMA